MMNNLGNTVLVIILLLGIKCNLSASRNIGIDIICFNVMQPDTIIPVQLFNIELTTQLDSKIGAGGFDSTIDFDILLVPDVCNSVDTIVNICRRWSKDNQLEIVKWEVKKNSMPYSLYGQFYAKELKGIFEISYRVNTEIGRVQCSFWFYSNTGIQKNPNLDKYKGLTDKLLDAMQCTR